MFRYTQLQYCDSLKRLYVIRFKFVLRKDCNGHLFAQCKFFRTYVASLWHFLLGEVLHDTSLRYSAKTTPLVPPFLKNRLMRTFFSAMDPGPDVDNNPAWDSLQNAKFVMWDRQRLRVMCANAHFSFSFFLFTDLGRLPHSSNECKMLQTHMRTGKPPICRCACGYVHALEQHDHEERRRAYLESECVCL